MPGGWLEAVQGLADQGGPGVLVTVVVVRGHAPREAGAKMVVGLEQTWDSVGGGNLEATAVERSRALLACRATTPELLTLRLTDRAPNEYGRQCCGGEVTLLLEPLQTARPHLAVFGVGHVGLALANILSTLPVRLHLIDSREGQLTPERLAGLPGGAARLHVHHAPIPELALADLPAGTHLVIMTHDHAEDAALCDAALRRRDLGFVGLIGSRVKWLRFQEQLKEVGHTEADLARITTPVGLPGIRGKSPAVIALGVAAQLQQVLEATEFSAVSPAPIPQRTP
ncbi:xanthine dehydrogenase accessory protein XdhC (plasmid) [Deinococcus aetherius]|uniref:Xanthine dehydrogenase accessory protein XdhC n=1 Tax=Deinococcus aetherius TaxID=200252 RepID=A0ABN6RNU2_9DEIO|nr:xanthine dehydrogenase accessory protein XdhC [Deinococcus aetherius]BDP44394.1 xanthine dehydrogenase accessory protein XdhC [Deinococcus aetherius]